MTNEEREASTFADWTVRLECGHRVAVPYGVAVPAMAACLVHHQEVCPQDAFADPAEFGVALPIPRGASFP